MLMPNAIHLRCIVFFCLCVTALAGCSGSGSSDAPTQPAESDLAVVGDDAPQGAADETAQVPMDPTDLEQDNQTATDDSNDSSEESPTSDTPTSTRVEFNITVPALQSSALQVSVALSDTVLTAAWVADEQWKAVTDLSLNTEYSSSISFHDDNGSLLLARYDMRFTTETAATQTINITASQFDTESWDEDNDGFSNFEEVSAGADAYKPNSTLSLPQAVQAHWEIIADKTLRVHWTESDADYYRVLVEPGEGIGYQPLGEDLESTARFVDHRVPLYRYANARYLVQACNTIGCSDSDALQITGTLEDAVGRFSSTDDKIRVGHSVALSHSGNTLATSGWEGTHVFVRDGNRWQLQALLGEGAVTLSDDGETLVISRPDETCGLSGEHFDIDGNLLNGCESGPVSGAVYVYTLAEGQWHQQAYIRSPVLGYRFQFGDAVSISADGNTLAVGVPRADDEAGMVFIYTRTDGVWRKQAELRASNREGNYLNDELPGYRQGDAFGSSLSLSDDGQVLAVGAPREDSAATGINGDQSDNSRGWSGAVYVFARGISAWQEQAYIKASYHYTHPLSFGHSVALDATGSTLAVGTPGDDSIITGVSQLGPTEDEVYAHEGNTSGAVFMFERINRNWQQQAYIKASNTGTQDDFGETVSLSANGETLAVGAPSEASAATGVNGDQTDNSARFAGAVYVFTRPDGNWRQIAYLKSPEFVEPGPALYPWFGWFLSLSADGESLAVGGSARAFGAAYLY